MMALTNMRMICNSLYLYDKLTRDEPKLDELARLVEDLALGLKEKVLVFSQWEGTHRLMEPRLQKLGIGYALLCGKVPVNTRGKLIQRFRDDAKLRILLSTDAGGLGLNLQAASCVVNVEVPWNPAVLNQRVGRAHRLGQQRPVRVFNLLARGTIEEHIWNLLSFKQDLFAGVFDGTSNQVVMRPRGQNRFRSAVDELLKKDASLVSPEAPVHAPEKAPAPALPAPEPSAAAADQAAAPLVDFLGTMTRAFLGSAGAGADASSLPFRVTKEEGTGEPLLALSLADRQKVRAGVELLAGALKGLAASLR